MDSRLAWALHYIEHFGAVAFVLLSRKPVHEWRWIAKRGISREEVVRLFTERVAGERAVGVALVTGPYLAARRERLIVIDVDKPLGDKEKLAVRLARLGYPVVVTPRGVHIHALVREDVYVVELRVVEAGRVVVAGQGASLQPHLWTSPPSVRPVADGWFTYRWVLPDGRQVAKYDPRVAPLVEPPIVGLGEFLEDIASETGLEPVVYDRAPGGPVAEPKTGEPTVKRLPLYADTWEFVAVAPSLPLPRCLAWLLLGFLYATSHPAAANVKLQYPDLEPPVRTGSRFVTAAAAALTIAHLAAEVKWSDILALMEHGVEDWPEDEGQGLDRKLSYLFYMDGEGRVYPRYSGLGALSPLPVLGEEFRTRCFYGEACAGRCPWCAFRRLAGRTRAALLARQRAPSPEP